LFSFDLGGFQGEVKFQLTYSSGGAIDASKALREVNSICKLFLMSIIRFIDYFISIIVHRQNQAAPP
jgi:hypothetical protein